ncbi:MAG: hypothetical protein M3P06_03725 [Acidobacteriota bacterium]|nr:hypothetical protein [Acidobacteriota bacterium]
MTSSATGTTPVSNDTTRRRFIAGFCLIGISIVFAINPITHILGSGASTGATSISTIAMIGFLAPVTMILMIGSVFAITQLLRTKADRAGLIGGTLTLMGWAVSARIMVISQLNAILQNGVEGVPPEALGLIFQSAPIIFVSIIPVGLMFPIGLIILGVTIFATRPVHPAIGVLLAIGGVLFPLGRAVGLPWAVVSTDMILAATFALIAWQILARPEPWYATSMESAVSARA